MTGTTMARLLGAMLLTGWLGLGAAWGQAAPAVQPAPPAPARAAPAQPQSPGPGDAKATEGQDGAEAEEPPRPLSPETLEARRKLERLKVELDQREAALRREGLSNGELQAIRAQLDGLAEAIRGIIDGQAPRLEAARARLEQLGPKPAEGQPEEGDGVARDREERAAVVAELDETQRLARSLLVQAEQLVVQVSDRRRAAFTRSVFERTSGILSPELWSGVAASLPRDYRAMQTVAGDWLRVVRINASLGAMLLVGLALGAALALYGGRRYIAPRLVTRDAAAIEPSRRKRLLAGLAVLVLSAGPALAGSFVVYAALQAVGFLPGRVAPVVGALLAGLAFVAVIHALADSVLAPQNGPWRLVALSDRAAGRVTRFAVTIAAMIATGKTVEAVNGAISAGLPVAVATRGAFAVAVALLLAEMLRRFASTASTDEACLGPYVPTEAEIGGPVRSLGWLVAGLVTGSALVGYVAFASFVVDQLVWIAVVVALLVVGIIMADEFIIGSLKGPTRIATTLQANTGLRRRSLEQIAVLVNGAVRLALILAAAFLVLAPWGVDSADLLTSVRSAFFGFKVGDVTISPSAIALALLLFGLALAATRIVQRWLDNTFLPATDLDAGLRNSIRTVVGYIGFFIAAAMALSYLGLSLDKIAIVAGALSVGIGFGLQSIVNNFVSGLILLWERPIRVGDLIVVGDGEGHVRRISVRATEIETFDRSTVIIPNSNLISGVVKNRVRGDRTGRVIVSINVPRGSDPVRAAEILMSCATGHADVLREPGPRVVFKRIGDAALEFDLVAFVPDVDFQQRVTSDLNFAVFRCLREAGILVPPAVPALDVRGLGPVEQALDHIAEAIGARQGAGAP